MAEEIKEVVDEEKKQAEKLVAEWEGRWGGGARRRGGRGG